MNLPNKIKEKIDGLSYSIDEIGMSESQVICFDDMVLKIENQGEESDNEYRMMSWLSNKLPVPKVLHFENENGMNYLLMSRIKGKMSCSTEFLEEPQKLIRLLAEGLRLLWEVDTLGCPQKNLIDNKLRLAEIRVQNNLCTIEDAEPSTYGNNGFKNPRELLQWLKENKPDEEPVFSHGDYCLPNIIIKDNQVAGFVDLGRSGIADIYQDIALCYRSLLHNFDGTYGGKVYDGLDATILFDELKIVPDWDKIKFYILLDELF